MVEPITDTTFDADVLSSRTPVLVEFGAAWCPPCRMIAPVLEAVAAERAGRLRVVTIDVDAHPSIQTRYGVLSLPTLLLFAEGRPVRRVVGYTAKGALLRVVGEAMDAAA